MLPEPADFADGAPVFGAFLDRFAELGAERQRLPVDAFAEHGGALVRNRAIELVGGIGEQLDAVLDQFGGDGIERDAGFLQFGQNMPGVLDIFFQAVARLAVIAEGVERAPAARC